MYKLPESININQIDEIRKDLLSYINQLSEEKSEVILDCGTVKDIDAAGIQLLISVLIMVKRRELDINLINTEDLNYIFRITGLKNFIRGIKNE